MEVDDSGANNVQVCIRLRPVQEAERAWKILDTTPPSLQLVDPRARLPTAYCVGEYSLHSFMYERHHDHSSLAKSVADHIFDEDTLNKQIFDASVKGLIRSVMEGYNGTVFAYGQTAAGKTHTMLGK